MWSMRDAPLVVLGFSRCLNWRVTISRQLRVLSDYSFRGANRVLFVVSFFGLILLGGFSLRGFVESVIRLWGVFAERICLPFTCRMGRSRSWLRIRTGSVCSPSSTRKYGKCTRRPKLLSGLVSRISPHLQEFSASISSLISLKSVLTVVCVAGCS